MFQFQFPGRQTSFSANSLSRHPKRSRSLRFESLENRTLMTASAGAASIPTDLAPASSSYLAAAPLIKTAAQADLIDTVGTAQTRAIQSSQDMDWLKFKLNVRSNVSIHADALGGDEVQFRLYGPNSSTKLVATANTSPSDTAGIVRDGVQNLAAGIYYIRVHELTNWTPQTTYEINVTATSSLVGEAAQGNAAIHVSIQNVDAPDYAIDPTRPTWVVIHGMNSAAQNDDIQTLARAIKNYGSGNQVLTLNWSEGAQEGPFAAHWIQSVGTWAAQALTRYGFTASQLNLVGHSWGCDVADILAAKMPSAKVNSIVAIDPGFLPSNYNLGGLGNINFSAHSRTSWAFLISDGKLDSPPAARTATEQFLVNYSFHTAMPYLYANLITSTNGAKLFGLEHLTKPGVADAWVRNSTAIVFDSASQTLTGKVEKPGAAGAYYEAVITADISGDFPMSVSFIDAHSKKHAELTVVL